MKPLHLRISLLAALALLASSLCPDRTLVAAPEEVAPQGQDQPGEDSGAGKPPALSEHKGVIEPPPTGDEGIEAQVPDPNAGHPEEVIPPPGTPGGDPNIEPR